MDRDQVGAVVRFLLRPVTYLVFFFVLTVVSSYGYETFQVPDIGTWHIGTRAVWQVCLAVALVWGLIGVFTTWTFVSFLALISGVVISLMSWDMGWRLFGSLVGTVWVSVSVYLGSGEIALFVFGVYATPGGARITDAASAETRVAKGASLTAFFVGFATLAFGLLGIRVPYQITMLLIALLTVTVSGTLASEESEVFKYLYPVAYAAVLVTIGLGLYAAFASMNAAVPQPDQLWPEAKRIFSQSFQETVLGYIIFALLLMAFGKINKKSAILQTGAWLLMLIPLTWLYVGGGLNMLLGLPAQAKVWWVTGAQYVSQRAPNFNLWFLLNPDWYIANPLKGTIVGAGAAGGLAGGFNRGKIFGYYVAIAVVGWSVYYLHLTKVI